jgi:TPR repeat protein
LYWFFGLVVDDFKTPLAEQSRADAQYNLGIMYDNGHGVPENDKTSVKWYTKAAEQEGRVSPPKTS